MRVGVSIFMGRNFRDISREREKKGEGERDRFEESRAAASQPAGKTSTWAAKGVL